MDSGNNITRLGRKQIPFSLHLLFAFLSTYVTAAWRIELAATASCGCPLPIVPEERQCPFRWLSAQWTRFEFGALREIEHQMSTQEKGLTLRESIRK